MSETNNSVGQSKTSPTATQCVDVVLIGAGIMSAHLAALINILEPQWSIQVYERADASATESSESWNNAGTGHSALCELNYTPVDSDGEIDISKAIITNEKFQLSRQWWSYAVRNKILSDPKDFINPTAHVSFVHGADNVYYLKKRYETLRKNPLFEEIQYTQDKDVFSAKLPLMARGRNFSVPFAISWCDDGTDISYGALTRKLFQHLNSRMETFYNEEVKDLHQCKDGTWEVSITNRHTHQKKKVRTKFLFIGAGGYSLLLLQKSGIPQRKNYAGFPVSGVFARCNNPEVIAEHSAKVYGKAAVGSPPMSAPHLDTRVIDKRKGLLFGPFAAWSPKFLKHGSYLDLFESIKPYNILPMASATLQEMSLSKFLLLELLKTHSGKIADLRRFYPQVQSKDWDIITAGQRVQTVRRIGNTSRGVLEFGTALVTSSDGSLATILGASPGASIVVSAIIEVLHKCFPAQYEQWRPQLEEMIPSLGKKLVDHPELYHKIIADTKDALQLSTPSTFH